MSNVLEISHLTKRYPGFTLDNISFSFPPGYIMGFVGQNGAGKTTTIRLMLNMTGRDRGDVKIFGMDNLRDEQEIKQNIGVVLDSIFFVENWTVAEVENVLKRIYMGWSSRLYRQYAENFRLPFKKRVKDLSRGMKMKLMLAVAMSHEARLLILDEPTSGLDPVARNELLEILSDYISDGEKSILFSTQITSDLEKVADYITLIDYGRIFYTGPKDDLIERFRIVKGGPDDLPDPLRAKIIGLTQKWTGFSGLLPISETKTLPDKIVTESPTIDEILVAISKDGGDHEFHP
jgi:ABC-2 type transport system ATP-binding protein